MNSQIIHPLLQFMDKAESGLWLCDFQFNRVNYASKDIACTIRAHVNSSATTFVIDIEDEDIKLCDTGSE